MSRVIIGLCGLAGSGKSTVAKCLEQIGYQRVAFADPLKDMLAAVGFTREQLYGSEKEVVVPDLGVTPRYAMQTLGTEWGRDLISERFWIDLWGRKVATIAGPVVADDIRFQDEADAVRAAGGIVWEVIRPGVGRQAHASEQQDIQADWVIRNDTTLDELSWLVAGLAKAAREAA